MLVYIIDDTCYLVYKNKVIKEKFKAIDKGFINNRTDFIEEFIKIMKREKIKSKLFGEEIIVIKYDFYHDSYEYYLESIFAELGFTKVIFWNVTEFLPNDNTTYIEVNKDYCVLFLDKTLYLPLYYFNDIPKLLDYLKSFLKNDIILLGTNKNIPKIRINNKNIYYFENYNSFIIDSLLKVKKCDA